MSMLVHKRLPRNFLNKQSISQHLFCPVCLEIFDSPLRAPCGHTYCCRCIYQWMELNKSCPVCKQRIKSGKSLEKDIIPEKIVQDLEVKCANKGCHWRGKNEQLRAHFVGCCHRKVEKYVEPRYSSIIEILEGDSESASKQLIDLGD